MKDKRSYDIVIWGASGFTGKLVCQYLMKNYGVGIGSALRWTIAGRNHLKLETIRKDLKLNDPEKMSILIGDSFDLESLKAITSKTKVILTTVGPYSLYGSAMVEACIQTQTHYCDLTGETPFIHHSINNFHESAEKAKVKIVHSCGFDSVPSDLGCFMLQDRSICEFGTPLKKIRLYVRKIKGGVSGGTIASMIEIMKLAKNKDTRRILKNPYSLYPKNTPKGRKQPHQKKIQWDEISKCWTGPFIMSWFNSAIVRRTNALLNFKYGKDFIYDEVSVIPKKPLSKIKAQCYALGLGFFTGMLYFRLTRWLLSKTILPKPGQGPSEKSRKNGFFILDLIGAQSNNTLKVTVSCGSDPGYSGTALMIGEAAVCLALDEELLPQNFGILTPATAMGKTLANRLKKAGMEFEYSNED